MIKIILLLSPVFISFFWLITIYLDAGIRSGIRSYFAFFLLAPFICFSALFVKFASLTAVFPYADILLAYAGSMVFPLYHIYFRLLTIDAKISFSKHFPFLIAPIIIASIYTIGVFIIPSAEYRNFLNNKLPIEFSANVQFLSVMQIVLWLHLLIQLAITVFWNYILISRYGGKAEQFYSDISDGNVFNAKMLNYSILIISVSSFVSYLLVNRFRIYEYEVINVLWIIFSFTLYIIGYIGFKQKALNPTFELETVNPDSAADWKNQSTIAQKKILEKMLVQFEENKIYLHSKLNIMDIVQAVGTNRTYISAIINQHYNQHFCAFVNSYRLVEMEKVYLANPTLSNETLAELSGFGSVNSCNRALTAKTGLSLAEWKRKKMSLETSLSKKKKNAK